MAETLDLEAIERRAEKATPGPWSVPPPEKYGAPNHSYVEAPSGHVAITHVNGIYRDGCVSDAAFIAHAREDIPALIAEVRRLTAERDEAREALSECAAPFVLGRSGEPFDYERLAREFNRRQTVATKALGQKTLSEASRAALADYREGR